MESFSNWIQPLVSIVSLGLMATGAVIALIRRALPLSLGLLALALPNIFHLVTWQIPIAINGMPPEWIMQGGMSRWVEGLMQLIGVLGWALIVLGILLLPRANAKAG